MDSTPELRSQIFRVAAANEPRRRPDCNGKPRCGSKWALEVDTAAAPQKVDDGCPTGRNPNPTFPRRRFGTIREVAQQRHARASPIKSGWPDICSRGDHARKSGA